MRLSRTIVGLVTTACMLGGASSALACGSDLTGPVVEHGVSRGGQVWSQLACLISHQLDVDLSLPAPDGGDSGGGMVEPMPDVRHALYVDAPGFGFGRHHNELLVDGVAFRAETHIELFFKSGPPRRVPTVQAPARERRRYAYLRRLRFFVYFLTDPRGLPKRICALNAQGRRSGCQRVGFGG